MVQLLSEDVPSLSDWGTRFIIDLLTGKSSITCTRSAWVADEASTLIRAILPQRSLAFASTRHDGRHPGALNIQRAGGSYGPRSFQPPNRQAFPAKGGPRDVATRANKRATAPATKFDSANAASATRGAVKTLTIPRPASANAPSSGGARASRTPHPTRSSMSSFSASSSRKPARSRNITRRRT